jgi:hypothetical protein
LRSAPCGIEKTRHAIRIRRNDDQVRIASRRHGDPIDRRRQQFVDLGLQGGHGGIHPVGDVGVDGVVDAQQPAALGDESGIQVVAIRLQERLRGQRPGLEVVLVERPRVLALRRRHEHVVVIAEQRGRHAVVGRERVEVGDGGPALGRRIAQHDNLAAIAEDRRHARIAIGIE